MMRKNMRMPWRENRKRQEKAEKGGSFGFRSFFVRRGFLLEIKKRVFILITSWCSCACTEVSS